MAWCITVIINVLILCVFGLIDNYMDGAFKEKNKWNDEVIKNHEQRIRQLEKILEAEGKMK